MERNRGIGKKVIPARDEIYLEPGRLVMIDNNDATEWEELKKRGNPKYKGEVEPIDLIKDGGMLRNFALSSIIKYAFRNRTMTNEALSESDLDKIIHYAEMLKVAFREGEQK